MVDNKDLLIQIMQTLNNFQLQNVASFNELRAEIKKSREIENEHWQENLRRWDENDKRWEENNKRWKQNEINRERDHQEILDIFINYDISISKKLRDPNVEKMKKVLKM